MVVFARLAAPAILWSIRGPCRARRRRVGPGVYALRDFLYRLCPRFQSGRRKSNLGDPSIGRAESGMAVASGPNGDGQVATALRRSRSLGPESQFFGVLSAYAAPPGV